MLWVQVGRDVVPDCLDTLVQPYQTFRFPSWAVLKCEYLRYQLKMTHLTSQICLLISPGAWGTCFHCSYLAAVENACESRIDESFFWFVLLVLLCLVWTCLDPPAVFFCLQRVFVCFGCHGLIEDEVASRVTEYPSTQLRGPQLSRT